jgi:signal transduction histidine kinase/phage shock protein PspC (stress-responsive transcriptional regulator)
MVASGVLRDHRVPASLREVSIVTQRHPGGVAARAAAPQGSANALTRSADERVIGGVCGGIADWLGLSPPVVRAAFVALAVAGGVGAIVYVALWLLLPVHPARGARLPRATARDPSDQRGASFPRVRAQRALAIGLVVLGSLLLLRELGLWFGDRFVWPVTLAALGVVLAWPDRPGQDAARGLPVDIPGRRPSMLASRVALLRLAAGLGAVAAGAAVFVATNADLEALGDSLLAATLAVSGLLLIFGPWWWRLGKELFEERRRRVRSEERAELAARVHDSVLQTLALIQQNATDPVAAARLARRQERELRSLLFGNEPPPTGTVKAAMRSTADEVEDLYGITVELVVVGDCTTDDALHALVAATKEALVNAAKFSGEPSVALYVEVEPRSVTAFVRDRGAGFDPTAVSTDRRGITESVVARIERQAGRATVHSAPGQGTEVELIVPRSHP